MAKKYYDNEAFQEIVFKLKDSDKEAPVIGDVWIGPMEPDTLSAYERLLAADEKKVCDMRLALSLVRMANQLGIKYVDDES